jgi:hypothetical protein
VLGLLVSVRSIEYIELMWCNSYLVFLYLMNIFLAPAEAQYKKCIIFLCSCDLM